MNAKNFLQISSELGTITGPYISPEKFKEAFNQLDNIELKSLLYHYIIDNTPYIFERFINRPLLFEQIKQYMSYVLDIAIDDIKLIGSAKTGFSISPDTYGRIFSSSSDVDLTIINEKLFTNLSNDFNKWKNEYLSYKVEPKNDREKSFWQENIKRLTININKGFLDTYKIPNIEICPYTKKINNSLYLVKYQLEKLHGVRIKNISARVYKDESSFYQQFFMNISHVMNII
jgi:hypothetical protein